MQDNVMLIETKSGQPSDNYAGFVLNVKAGFLTFDRILRS